MVVGGWCLIDGEEGEGGEGEEEKWRRRVQVALSRQGGNIRKMGR